MKGIVWLAAIAAALGATAPAAANPPDPPVDLRVNGGEEWWRADNGFRLDWDNPTEPGAQVVAVRYRVRDAGGAVVVPQREIGWAADVVEDLMVPEVPGIYTAEVWLVDAEGEESPPATAKLRFDNAQPAQLEPFQIPTWLGRGAFPYLVSFHYPSNMLPVSGIDGYAVVLDASPEASPCAGATRCTVAETDLRAGLGSNTFAISGLPEGTAYIHAVAVSGSRMRSARPIDGEIRVDLTDPVTRLIGAPPGWTNQPVALTAIAADTGSGMEAGAGGPAPFTALSIDEGLPRTAAGGSVSATVITEGVHSVAFYARDAAGNVNDGGTTNGVPNPKPATAVVRIDRSAPSVAFANSEASSEPEVLRVRVTDPLSGPDLRRGSLGVRRAGSDDAFVELPTEPARDGFRARWDSESYARGEYEFRAVGYDAAGNATATMSRADGLKMVLSSPLKEISILRAGLGGSSLNRTDRVKCDPVRHCRSERTGEPTSATQLTVPYGRRVMLSGLLSEGVGLPLSGRQIEVVERFVEDAGWADRISTARTGSDGTFSLRLPAGPSREVTAVFDGGLALTHATAGPLQLAVRTRVSLGVSASVAKVGGPPLIFHGKVAAAKGEIPADGKSVQLQFRLPGTSWSEFRTIQTDREGRFRYRYRFSDDDSRGVRFLFRAFAPAQGDWPYEPGGSRPVAVRGR